MDSGRETSQGDDLTGLLFCEAHTPALLKSQFREQYTDTSISQPQEKFQEEQYRPITKRPAQRNIAMKDPFALHHIETLIFFYVVGTLKTN